MDYFRFYGPTIQGMALIRIKVTFICALRMACLGDGVLGGTASHTFFVLRYIDDIMTFMSFSMRTDWVSCVRVGACVGACVCLCLSACVRAYEGR